MLKKRSVYFDLCKKIALILIGICGLSVSLEAFYRTWLYLHNCETACYDIKFFTRLDAFNRDASYSFLSADRTLGYSPADGSFVNREQDGAKITIDEGVRVNPNFAPNSAGGPILVVGGSFVFGDNAPDSDTWPAILERRLNRRVVNGGVSGYGPLQAVMRADHLLKAQAYSLVILSIAVGADISRDRYVNFSGFYRPAVIREGGRLRQTTLEESGRIVAENAFCAHRWISELLYWSYTAKRLLLKLGYNGRCPDVIHPKAATADEILDFVIERVAALSVSTVIAIQYPRYSFEISIDEARKIRDAANRHGVPMIDTYNALKETPLLEILKSGNEVVAGLIAREIAAMAP